MEVLTHYQTLLTNLFKSLNYDSKSVKFLNNKTDHGPKEGHEAKWAFIDICIYCSKHPYNHPNFESLADLSISNLLFFWKNIWIIIV